MEEHTHFSRETSLIHEPTDAELAQQARADNKDAFNQLMERYRTMAFYLALRLLPQEEIAREMVQEAMLQAFLSLHHLRDEARFKSWFYGIVLNVCRNWRREQKPLMFSLDTEDSMSDIRRQIGASALLIDPQEVVERQELYSLLRDALNILSENNRAVALLFYYEDLSMQEIASKLHITLPAVKNRLFKSREQLRMHLQTHHPELSIKTTRKRRGGTMIPVTIKRIVPYATKKLVLLLDEPGQRVLPVWIDNWEIQEQYRFQMHPSHVQSSKLSEPLTIDFIANLLQVLSGTLQSVELDELQEDILYTKLSIRAANEETVHNINARLNDGFPLGLRVNSAFSVADTLLERKGIRLTDVTASSLEAQIDQLISNFDKSTYLSTTHIPSIARLPQKLNFVDDLSSWSFAGVPRKPDYHSYRIDPSTTHNGKASLAITAKEAEPVGIVNLVHQGFLADGYKGKRLRMTVYVKSEDVKRANWTLQVLGQREMNGRKVPYPIAATATPQLIGTHDWTKQELVLDVAPDSCSIRCNFMLLGPGKAWLSEIQFAEVDTDVALTEAAQQGPLPDELQNGHFQHDLASWELWGSFPQDYERGTGTLGSLNGSTYGYIQASVPQPRGNGNLRQTIRARNYVGKQVRLSASIKTEGVETQALLYLSSEGVEIHRVQEKTVQSPEAWTPYEVTLDVPNASIMLRFGVMLYGKGRVYMSDVKLDVVPDRK